MMHEISRRFDAMLQKNRADHGFHRVGEDRRLVATSSALFAAAEVDNRAQVELTSNVCEGSGVDDSGTQLRKLAFGEIWVGDEKVLGHDQTEHRVAKKFQTLIRRQPTLLVGVGAVGQRAIKQLRIDTHPELGQQLSGGQANCSRL
jgi:hypothetical protein